MHRRAGGSASVRRFQHVRNGFESRCPGLSGAVVAGEGDFEEGWAAVEDGGRSGRGVTPAVPLAGGRRCCSPRAGEPPALRYCSVKLTVRLKMTSTGSPFIIPGLNFHFLTASSAASVRPSDRPFSTLTLSTLPSLSMIASTITTPVIFPLRARSV